MRRPGPLLCCALLALAPVASAFAQGFGGTVTDMLVRGEALLRQNRASEAIVQFQEARTLCATPAEMVHALQGEAMARLSRGETLPAVGLLEEAATTYPDDPRVADILATAGQALAKAGENARAADLLRRALGKNPTPNLLPPLRLQLAMALRLSGRPAEAVNELKDFQASFPDHALLPNVLYTLGIASHDIPDLQASETWYRTLIEKFPGRAAAVEAHFELADVVRQRGDARGAAELYRRYVALSPSSPLAAAALERAADTLLWRAPRESAELYGLAVVKASVNPAPPERFKQGSWFAWKKRLAESLSRPWILAVAALAVAAVPLVLGRRLLRRRKQSDPVRA